MKPNCPEKHLWDSVVFNDTAKNCLHSRFKEYAFTVLFKYVGTKSLWTNTNKSC